MQLVGVALAIFITHVTNFWVKVVTCQHPLLVSCSRIGPITLVTINILDKSNTEGILHLTENIKV